MKTTPAFKQTIKSYLEERGSKDPLFAHIITKPGKNIDDCITYILNTVKNSGFNGFTDDEVYSMAIHYFDEDNVKAGPEISCQVVVNHKVELTEEEKTEARKKAMEELTNEIKAKARKKPEPVKTTEEKEKPVTTEQSLF
jgi:hypothetical protein